MSSKWIGNLPPAVVNKDNGKHEWSLEEIKEFVDVADNFRDKAIILVMFQSGIGINELYDLDYGDVEHELKAGKLPLLLNVVRKKRGIIYKTFLGADAVKYLKLYLETRRDLNPDSPLFAKRDSEERLTRKAIQWRFKEMAKDLSFVRVKKGAMNPARPHSMRSAFRSRLTGKMDGDLIEFFMGHAISGTKVAYINLPTDELRELYAQFEHELSIETTSKKLQMEGGKGESVLSQVYIDRIKSLEVENKVLMNKIVDLVSDVDVLKNKIEEVELLLGERTEEERAFWADKDRSKRTDAEMKEIFDKALPE